MSEEKNELLAQQEIRWMLVPQHEGQSSPRFPYRVVQRIAPIRRGIQGRFRQVSCCDISRGGISFFLESPPDFDEFVIELKQGEQQLSVVARVVGHDPIPGIAACLVRCQFTRRAGS